MRVRPTFAVVVCCGVAAAAAGSARADEAGGAAKPEDPRLVGKPRAEGKLEPLPPASILLERVKQESLEDGPVRETLDDVMRRAAARNPAAVAAAEAVKRQQFIRQQALNFEQTIEPLLTVELTFARRACGGLSAAARREVLAAAREALREVAERLARLQFEGDGGAATPFDVRRELHERVAAALAPRVTEPELADYDRAWQLRRARREEAARIRIVAKLDGHLGLTAAQRRDVLEDLRAHWQPGWIRELEDQGGLMNQDLPPAPDFADASIAPHLDPDQLEHWRQWRAANGSQSRPRSAVDWSELNVLQPAQRQGQQPDAWWRP